MTHPRLARPLALRTLAVRLALYPFLAALGLVILVGFTHPEYIRSTGVQDGRATLYVPHGEKEKINVENR